MITTVHTSLRIIDRSHSSLALSLYSTRTQTQSRLNKTVVAHSPISTQLNTSKCFEKDGCENWVRSVFVDYFARFPLSGLSFSAGQWWCALIALFASGPVDRKVWNAIVKWETGRKSVKMFEFEDMNAGFHEIYLNKFSVSVLGTTWQWIVMNFGKNRFGREKFIRLEYGAAIFDFVNTCRVDVCERVALVHQHYKPYDWAGNGRIRELYTHMHIASCENV